MWLLLGCSSPPPPAPPPPPVASFEELRLGAAFETKLLGDDVPPEQVHTFEQAAGAALKEEQAASRSVDKKLGALVDELRAPSPNPVAVSTLAAALGDADLAAMKQGEASLCALVDVLDADQKAARFASGALAATLGEALPRSATNPFDFASTWLRPSFDTRARAASASIDGGWVTVGAAVRTAEAALPTVDATKPDWCAAFAAAMDPVHQAWWGWHRNGVVAFADWLATRPLATRQAFVDGDHVRDAAKWSTGAVVAP